MISANYRITTDADKVYKLYFELYVRQDFEPKKLGVDKIRVAAREKARNYPNYIRVGEFKRSGIYNPKWDDNFMKSE